MHTQHLLKALPRCLLGALLAAGITTTAVNAVDGNPTLGLFELEGNIVDDSGQPAPDDWVGLALGQHANKVLVTTDDGNGHLILKDRGVGFVDRIYTGGGSKDVEDINAWRHTDTGGLPDKDDITNAYAAGYTLPADFVPPAGSPHGPNDLIIYFGLDRYANNGDAFAGFWFFQNDVKIKTDGTFEGTHVARDEQTGQRGDLLVLVEYPQGTNANPEIKVYEWDPAETGAPNIAPNLEEIFSSSEAKCDGTGNKVACAFTNADSLPLPPAGTNWAYAPKLGNKNVIPKESFFEGGINVSALLGGTVPCFSSFLAETRSSRSETAQLKDFVLGDFNLCSIAVTKQCVDPAPEIIDGDTIKVSFSGTVKNDGGLPLSDVTIEDEAGSGTAVKFLVDDGQGGTVEVSSVSIDELAAGEEVSYQGYYTTSQTTGILDDTVVATGSRGTASVSAQAKAECSPPAITPSIEVTKACAPPVLLNESKDGIVATFDVTVTNTGNVTLTDVTATDTTLGEAVTLNQTTLKPGESATGSVTHEAFGVPSVQDSASASGKPALGESVEVTDATDDPQAECGLDVTSTIEIVKSCDSVRLNATGSGIVADFLVTVTNTGQDKLTNIEATDTTLNQVVVLAATELMPGEFTTGHVIHQVEGAASASDTASVVATAAIGGVIDDVTDESATCSLDIGPVIDVAKECTKDAVAFGDPIEYKITLTNTGDVKLVGITALDTPFEGVSQQLQLPSDELLPGDFMEIVYGYTPTLPGTHTNKVDVTGYSAIANQVDTTDSATADCEVPPPPPPGDEGCTPGFWKNSPGSWPPTGYSPDQTVGSVFTIPGSPPHLAALGNDSLMTALGYPGGTNLVGSAQILLRAAVASLLNAAHPDVDFTRTAASVIADVNAALATKDRTIILALATELDADNNLGCDLPNDSSF